MPDRWGVTYLERIDLFTLYQHVKVIVEVKKDDRACQYLEGIILDVIINLE
jgi:hypothetical protein